MLDRHVCLHKGFQNVEVEEVILVMISISTGERAGES